MNILKLVFFVCILNTEGFCKAVAEVMAGSRLQSLSIVHQRLDCISRLCACKFFFVCFLAFYNRDCKNFLTEVCIYIQHLNGSLFRLFSCCMSSMAFLPQKFSGTQERTGCFFPADYRTPLIVNLRKISVGLDLLLIKIAEQSLRGRTHTETLLKRIQSAVSYPCNLRRKALYVILFFLKKRLRNKHRHVNILNACFFESSVQLILDVFPDGIAGRLDHHAALYACVIAKLCLFYYVSIPLRKIFLHGSDGFY